MHLSSLCYSVVACKLSTTSFPKTSFTKDKETCSGCSFKQLRNDRYGAWHFGHVYMIRAKSDGTLGTIENGYNQGNPGIHTNGDASYEVRLGNTTAWIRASDYANGLGSGFFKALYGFGKEFAWLMERFAQLCEETIANLQPYMISLFWIMAVIDLSMSIVLAGFEISPMSFIVRIMKYRFFYIRDYTMAGIGR